MRMELRPACTNSAWRIRSSSEKLPFAIEIDPAVDKRVGIAGVGNEYFELSLVVADPQFTYCYPIVAIARSGIGFGIEYSTNG